MGQPTCSSLSTHPHEGPGAIPAAAQPQAQHQDIREFMRDSAASTQVHTHTHVKQAHPRAHAPRSFRNPMFSPGASTGGAGTSTSTGSEAGVLSSCTNSVGGASTCSGSSGGSMGVQLQAHIIRAHNALGMKEAVEEGDPRGDPQACDPRLLNAPASPPPHLHHMRLFYRNPMASLGGSSIAAGSSCCPSPVHSTGGGMLNPERQPLLLASASEDVFAAYSSDAMRPSQGSGGGYGTAWGSGSCSVGGGGSSGWYTGTTSQGGASFLSDDTARTTITASNTPATSCGGFSEAAAAPYQPLDTHLRHYQQQQLQHHLQHPQPQSGYVSDVSAGGASHWSSSTATTTNSHTHTATHTATTHRVATNAKPVADNAGAAGDPPIITTTTVFSATPDNSCGGGLPPLAPLRDPDGRHRRGWGSCEPQAPGAYTHTSWGSREAPTPTPTAGGLHSGNNHVALSSVPREVCPAQADLITFASAPSSPPAAPAVASQPDLLWEGAPAPPPPAAPAPVPVAPPPTRVSATAMSPQTLAAPSLEQTPPLPQQTPGTVAALPPLAPPPLLAPDLVWAAATRAPAPVSPAPPATRPPEPAPPAQSAPPAVRTPAPAQAPTSGLQTMQLPEPPALARIPAAAARAAPPAHSPLDTPQAPLMVMDPPVSTHPPQPPPPAPTPPPPPAAMSALGAAHVTPPSPAPRAAAAMTATTTPAPLSLLPPQPGPAICSQGGNKGAPGPGEAGQEEGEENVPLLVAAGLRTASGRGNSCSPWWEAVGLWGDGGAWAFALARHHPHPTPTTMPADAATHTDVTAAAAAITNDDDLPAKDDYTAAAGIVDDVDRTAPRPQAPLCDAQMRESTLPAMSQHTTDALPPPSCCALVAAEATSEVAVAAEPAADIVGSEGGHGQPVGQAVAPPLPCDEEPAMAAAATAMAGGVLGVGSQMCMLIFLSSLFHCLLLLDNIS